MADDYELGTVGPMPTVNPNVAKIGELLNAAKTYANQYYVKDQVPLLGGTQLGDFLLGQAPEEIQRWGQGDYPVRNPSDVVKTGGNRADIWKSGRFEPTFDVAAMAAPALGKTAEITKGLPLGLGIKPVTTAEHAVSTRVPTAVKATENPITEHLFSNYEAAKKEPEAFKHNVELIKDYPNIGLKSKNVDVNSEKFINHVKDNLLYLHDAVPKDTRERSKLWYNGARNIVDKFGKEYGVPDQAASGVLAVLSPQKDWFMNVSLGERLISAMKNHQGTSWSPEMSNIAKEIWNKPQYAPMVKAIEGKTLSELSDPVEKAMWIRTHDQAHNPREHFIVNPEGDYAGVRLTGKGEPYKTGWGSLNEIAKGVNIYENPTKENISKNLGGQHKVRNFYMNIYDPESSHGHTTIDTHAVAAGLLRPLSGASREVAHNFGSNVLGEVGPKNSAFTGSQGTYPFYHEAYQRAAKERGVLPREMQSITWEAVRGLFPDTFKNAKNAEEIDKIWLNHKKGNISADEARKQVFEKAGGINEPEWKQ